MSAPLIHLSDRVALVTGASRGIGQAIALAYAQCGAKLVIAARKPEGLEAVAEQIRGAGGEVLAQACHTGDPAQVEALVAAAVARFGRVDVLVNNAATNPHFGPMLNVEWSAWEKTFEVNVRGYFAAARAVAQHLLDRGSGGAIVNVTSILGAQAAPLQGVYGMTKAAVISMTQTLAMELGSAGIRVNAIAPGFIRTRFSKVLVEDEQISADILRRTPLGRVGEPEDIAGLAVFLASDAARFITGATYVADGGLTVN